MKSTNILQVLAVVVAATHTCRRVQPTSALQSRALACADPQLDQIVRRISKIRAETRGGPSKLERCATFVEQIKQQPDLETILGLARDEPSDLFGEIIKILAHRASCPSLPLNGLSYLQDFAEDCQDLIELAAEAAEAERETAAEADDEAAAAANEVAANSDGLRECQESIAAQMETIRGLQEEIGKLSRELRARKGCAVVPGGLFEVEIVRARDGKLGLGINAVFGSAFVKRIQAGSPAATSGLRFGDQVISINGRAAADREVRESLWVRTAGSLRLLVKKSPFEQSYLLRRSSDRDSWGFQSTGGIVTSVLRDSPAARAGLMERLKIITINGESALGFSGQQYEKLLSGRTLELSLKLMPQSLYEQLTLNINVDEQRKENNKILRVNGP